jgi:hypothetical protein
LEAKVRDFLDDIQCAFECQNFERSIKFEDSDQDNNMCDVRYQEDYQRFSITIYPVFKTYPPEDQRKALLHELSHIITIPLSKINEDILNGTFHSRRDMRFAVERATSKIENILDGLLTGRLSYAVKAYARYLEP